MELTLPFLPGSMAGRSASTRPVARAAVAVEAALAADEVDMEITKAEAEAEVATAEATIKVRLLTLLLGQLLLTRLSRIRRRTWYAPQRSRGMDCCFDSYI